MSSDEAEPHAPVKQEADASMCDSKGEVFSAEQKSSASPETPPQPELAVGVMTEMEVDDLVFSDDAFPSLPDFPCLSSPSTMASPMSAASKKRKDPCLGNTSSSISSSSSSSVSSSSSSPWSILNVATASDAMQPAPACDVDLVVPNADIDEALPRYCDEFDILREIELWDPGETSDTWDNSSSLVPVDNAVSAGQLQPGVDPLGCGEDAECPSEDLAKVFLDWLKNNKDSISPEDLRSITLKRSTIECAARRLGGGKQGRVQLLKLILAWVQNHHLHKRRRRNRGMRDRMAEADISGQFSYPLPLNANPTLTSETAVNPHSDYSYEAQPPLPCNSWVPFPAEPTPFPAMISCYGGEASPYHFYNGQPFSPLGTPEFPADVAAVWPQGLSTTAGVPYHAFGMGPTSPHLPSLPASQYPAGFVAQYPGSQNVYNPHIALAGIASATKEARKKRMARQRRFSSLHHLKGQQNQQQHSSSTGDPLEHNSMALNEGGSGSSALSHVNNPRNWAIWSSLPSSSSQQDSSPPQKLLTPPPALPNPPVAQIPQKNPEKHASAVDRNQGWKTEKNLRFLLQKVLKQSDVGSLGRIVLPKKEAEIHLPELDARDGISIEMEDIGTSRVWNMRYRFWPNNKSRMYLLENTGDFVRSNGLQEGDFIVIYSDVKCGKYMIRGVKVRQPVDGKAVGRSTGKAHHKKEDGSQNCKAMAGGLGDGAEGKGNPLGNQA